MVRHPPFCPPCCIAVHHAGALVRAGRLPQNNLTALLFRLEHNQGIEDVQDLVQTVYNCKQRPEYRELRRAFVGWKRHVLLPRASPDVDIPEVDGLLGVKDMLTDHSRSWAHQWKMEGMEEGLQKGLQKGLLEGRREGRHEGEVALLQRLLIRKFRPLSEATQQRLHAASPAQLERWSLNILDAAALEDVFIE